MVPITRAVVPPLLAPDIHTATEVAADDESDNATRLLSELPPGRGRPFGALVAVDDAPHVNVLAKRFDFQGSRFAFSCAGKSAASILEFWTSTNSPRHRNSSRWWPRAAVNLLAEKLKR